MSTQPSNLTACGGLLQSCSSFLTRWAVVAERERETRRGEERERETKGGSPPGDLGSGAASYSRRIWSSACHPPPPSPQEQGISIGGWRLRGLELLQHAQEKSKQQGRFLVADTNNSTIRYVVLNERGAEVRTLDLTGVQPPSPKPKALKRLRRRLSADTNVINVDGGSSTEGHLSLTISVPDGYHFSKVYYCKEDEVCLYQSVAFDVKFQDAVPGPAQITLAYTVVPRDSSGVSQLIATRKNSNV